MAAQHAAQEIQAQAVPAQWRPPINIRLGDMIGPSTLPLGSSHIGFKPFRTSMHSAKRTYMAVESWIYEIKKHLNALQAGLTPLTDSQRLDLITLRLVGEAHSWGLIMEVNGKDPITFDYFLTAWR